MADGICIHSCFGVRKIVYSGHEHSDSSSVLFPPHKLHWSSIAQTWRPHRALPTSSPSALSLRSSLKAVSRSPSASCTRTSTLSRSTKRCLYFGCGRRPERRGSFFSSGTWRCSASVCLMPRHWRRCLTRCANARSQPASVRVLSSATRCMIVLPMAQSCSLLSGIQASTQIAEYLPWAVFSGLRALALSSINRTFGVIVFIFASVPFAANVWLLSIGVTGENLPVVGCCAAGKASIYATSVIVADSLVIGATWKYAIQHGVFRRGIRRITPSEIVDVLLYNGTIYFLPLVALNVTHLTLTVLSIVQVTENDSEVGLAIDPITAILIGRYMLALQAANQKVLRGGDNLSRFDADGSGAAEETLRFASRVIGSIGASIQVRDDDDEDLMWSNRETECEEVGGADSDGEAPTSSQSVQRG